MRYLYTDTPDESCHEIAGVYGRPVHRSEEPKLLALGWRLKPDGLRKHEIETAKEPSKEAPQEQKVDAELEQARAEYEEAFGTKPHHKMKIETIRAKLEQSDD